MDVNIICCLFVLVNEKNDNIRKNDYKKLKVLVRKEDKSLLNILFDNQTDIKQLIRNHISKNLNSNKFHLEQVYTLGDKKYYIDNKIDIIYIGICNEENINLTNEYELVDFNVSNNRFIQFDKDMYEYETKEIISNQNIEYIHEIQIQNIILEKQLLELLIAFKYLRSRVENTDIIFKFMPKYFTLEEVRIVYEMIKEISVDKSNFRKKIVKYCVEADVDLRKKGYRPSKMYTFQVLKGDVWL